ncbi:MAG: helix-turn-helix transcriptional regulator, partial [Bacteroidota bacterium]
YLRYLKQAAPQWPESLNNQWPILEWIALEFACQNKQEKERQFSNFASNEMLLLLKENRPSIDLETSLFWRLLNAHKRYEWALTDNRPMDALAYYRESHFHHSSLLASLSKPGVDYPQRAMNAGGKVSDFWFLVAFVGVLSVILWGRYHRGRIKSEAIALPAQDGVFSGHKVEYEDDEAVTVSRATDSSTPAYGDLASLWNSKLHTNQQWEDFKTKFNQCVPGFIPSLRLEYPRMTQSDIRLACLIRMGMTSVEISNIQNISNQGVSMARYRLRKRMGLGPDDSIPDKLNEFGS